MSPKLIFALGALSGLIATAIIHGTYAQAQALPAKSGPLVRVDETKAPVTYMNAYRIHTTPDEVVLDLGFSMPNPTASDPASGELLFLVSNRVVMTYSNAKKLQNSLGTLVKRYEEKFGEIPAPRSDSELPHR